MTSGFGSSFVARATELDFLRKFVASSKSGGEGFQPSAFLIQAPSGAGKSRLVDECLVELADVVHLRIELTHQHTYRGLRTEFLNAIIHQYRAILKSTDSDDFSDWMWTTSKNRKAVGQSIRSLADGFTFGSVTAIESLWDVVNSKSAQHIDDLFTEQTRIEDRSEELITKLGHRFSMAVTISNAQRLNRDDLEYLFEICASSKQFLTLEFTTDNFQHGLIEREQIAGLAQSENMRVSALILGPLQWEEACEISQNIGEDDEWARNYYQRHGFNLFDLKNLSGKESVRIESVCINDIGFGPSILPGIKNRYPATRQKLLELSKDEQLILCLLYLDGGTITKTELSHVVSVHLNEDRMHDLVDKLETKHGLVKQGREKQSVKLVHDSILSAMEDCLELLPLVKLSAKLWQSYYVGKTEITNAAVTKEPAFEYSIRLAFFSALIDSNDVLLEACQSIFRLSRYVSMKGNVRNTFLRILKSISASTLVPVKLKPVIAYYLGASAINFQDASLAAEVSSTMNANLLGTHILDALILQKQDKFKASKGLLDSIEKNLQAHLSGDDKLRTELVQIVNLHCLSNSSQKICFVKHKYRELLKKSGNIPECFPSILKHASIGYGYEESLPLLARSIESLENQGNDIEVYQAKLVQLMQLTRLGRIQEALGLHDAIKNAFPKNFSEEANLLNIQALLECFTDQTSINKHGYTESSARNLFRSAKRICRDEYSKIVLASNLFVYDNFLSKHCENERQKEDSLQELVHRLEKSQIGFRYLYVLGWFNLMNYYELKGNTSKAQEYRGKIGNIDESDSLLWQCAMGITDPVGTEVEFLTSTPYMFAFLPNYQISPPSFNGRVDKISEIISR